MAWAIVFAVSDMARRIFRNIALSTIAAVLLTALLVVPALYSAHEESMSRELQQEADSVVQALEALEDDVAYLKRLKTHSRITLIAPDGSVVFDSMADAAQMENHAQRPEIIQAFENGKGQSTRTSDTLSEITLYYALRTSDDGVLRLADTRRSMLGTFVNVLPLMIAMLLVVALTSLILARRTAVRIVAPINALDLDQPLENEAYDELAPLLTRMHKQHEQIGKQMKALEDARAELAAIMQNMQEGMILLDKHAAVLSINESAAHIFGVSVLDSVGQNLLAVDRDADLHERVQQALEGEGGTLRMQRGKRQYELYISPVQKDKAVCGAVILLLDVTERFAAEEGRREFSANVSHELKTPLTSISGFAEIILDGIAQPQDVQHFAGMICKESARLLALVNDILELSRLDEGQSMGPKEKVALLPLLRELREEFRMAAEKKQLMLTVVGEDAAVYGYPMLLREMFFNLIDNAVKYTPAGGKVAVTVEADETDVRCTVSDTGIGIPKEHQVHVFERFYRVDKSHSRQTGGTGLGLAIVKHAAQLHHAEVKLESCVGDGTKVQVIFPTDEAAQ